MKSLLRSLPLLVMALVCGTAWSDERHNPVLGPDEEEQVRWCDEADLLKPIEEQDCVQGAGAAIGEVDPMWRQRLPPKVRWITSRDAMSRCAGDVGVYGKKVETLGTRGCVWVSSEACTILTVVHVAHSEIGNALRSCAVK